MRLSHNAEAASSSAALLETSRRSIDGDAPGDALGDPAGDVLGEKATGRPMSAPPGPEASRHEKVVGAPSCSTTSAKLPALATICAHVEPRASTVVIVFSTFSRRPRASDGMEIAIACSACNKACESGNWSVGRRSGCSWRATSSPNSSAIAVSDASASRESAPRATRREALPRAAEGN